MRVVLGLAVAALVTATVLSAEEPLLSHAGCSAPGDPVEPALLERPTAMVEGIGRVHQDITTGSAGAQAYYDQGLTQLHHYVWIEAARSFHQALRLDADCAMCWMGLARAEQGMERAEATATAIARALALAPKAGERERRFIALRAQQIAAQNTAEDAEKHGAYKAALDAALATYPDDAELWVLRGNAEEPGAWGRGQFGGAASIAFYETALVRSPGHLGAHHYLVHSFENIAHHAEAAGHAKVYAAASPRVAHAQHMFGHVLPRLGRWEEALAQFRKADEIEETYARSVGLRPGDDWHHLHNLQLLGFTALRLGRADEAEAAFRRAFETPSRVPYRGREQAGLAELYLLQGRLQEALAAARAIQAATRTPAARTVGAAVEGEALLALGRLEAARAAAARSAELLEVARREAGSSRRYVDVVVKPYVEQLRAALALRADGAGQAEGGLLAVADDVAANPRFDAWGEGLFRLQRLAQDARRAGRAELAAGLEARMRKIDAAYAPKPMAGGPR